jgi:DNA-directed RNA polymerase subunit RPC12/RpoP
MRFMSAETKKKGEAESRQWIGKCSHCGAENSIWDLGGLRFGAAGRPTKWVRCPKCRKSGAHTFEKRI